MSIAFLALALVACGEEAVAENTEAPAANVAQVVANATVLQGQPPTDLAGARALIDRIYRPYTRDEIPQSLDDLYTPELTAAIARASDPEVGLGYDPFCSCQDFGQFSYTIASLEPATGGAVARVSRSNFGESSSVTLTLAYRGGRWLVGDIADENGSLLNGN